MRRTLIALRMACAELLRNRLALLLFLLLPASFEALTYVTAPTHLISFELATLGTGESVEIPARVEAFIYMAVISVAFIAAFTGMSLMQKSINAQRRLVLNGFSVFQIFCSRIVTLLIVVVMVSFYSGCIVEMLIRSPRFPAMVAGLALTGFVYGAYGMLVGSLWKRDLESVLSVVLLTDIDVGWLQNPIFYTEALNRNLIHYLPGYFPAQVAMVGGLTEAPVGNAVLHSLLF